MSNFHRRCAHVSETGQECEIWFSLGDDETKRLCPIHSGEVSPEQATKHEETRSLYITRRKEQEVLCANMSLDELDEHIAKIEVVIEEEKMRLLTARATKSNKLDLLSEAERAERRKIKTSRPEGSEPAKPRKPKSDIPTLKSDPVRYMMLKHGFTEEQAKRMLGAD